MKVQTASKNPTLSRSGQNYVLDFGGLGLCGVKRCTGDDTVGFDGDSGGLSGGGDDKSRAK